MLLRNLRTNDDACDGADILAYDEPSRPMISDVKVPSLPLVSSPLTISGVMLASWRMFVDGELSAMPGSGTLEDE